MSRIIYRNRMRQLTTTTGTGNLVFSGTVAGFATFLDDSGISYGVAFPYEIHAVDANGVPTGDWETGIGRLIAGGGAPSWELVCEEF